MEMKLIIGIILALIILAIIIIIVGFEHELTINLFDWWKSVK